jgi:hypothetical protein
MTHLKTIPTLNVFRITRILSSNFEMRLGIYGTIARMMTGFLAVATFLVWTVSDIMAHLLTFLALNSFHIHWFLHVIRSDSWMYRTFASSMTFPVTIGAEKFGFLRTITAHMTRLVAATTSNRSQKFRSQRFIAFF